MLRLSLSKKLGAIEIALDVSVDGGVVALFGPSGAGKTSIAQMVAGLMCPDEGRVVVGEKVLFDHNLGINLPPELRGLGYVFQDARLFPHLTVHKNLLFAPTSKQSRGEFDHVVHILGLEPLLIRHPPHLSGGEKQRVAIGRALLADPCILIMDEPLSNLDEARKAEIMPYMHKLVEQSRIPILYISHAMAEIVALAKTLVVLDRGRQRAVGVVEELLARPDLSPFTGIKEAGVVVTATIMAQNPSTATTHLDFRGNPLVTASIPGAVGESVRLRIHAKDVVISLDPPSRISFRNALKASIDSIERAPDGMVNVMLDVDGSPLWAQISVQSLVALHLSPGMVVWALFKTARMGDGAPSPKVCNDSLV